MDKEQGSEAHAPPIVTIKAKMDVVSEISKALTPSQLEIFKKTCFGHWLDVGIKKNNNLLIHTLLTCMVGGKPSEMMSFDIQGKRIHFRREEFCLVTGLRFGSNMYMKEWVKDLTDNPFRTRIFPDIEADVAVKLSNVTNIFYKMIDGSLVLEDNDAVRICLLVLLQQGFLGHQGTHNVPDDMLKLVENIPKYWNIFPWGSYVWEYTFPQLKHALGKRKENHEAKVLEGKKVAYTLSGFVWAFMIWILEAVPATHRFVRKNPIEILPRAVAWESSVSFSWTKCCNLFVGNDFPPPLETLKPTKAEMESEWCKASFDYFEGKNLLSEHHETEKDGINEKKRKRGSETSTEEPTYEELMTTVATLTKTVSTLHDTIGTLESRIKSLEGDKNRVTTLTQTVSRLESRLLALEGDENGVASDGDITYMSPATSAQKSLPLANRRQFRAIRTPARLKSPMQGYARKRKKIEIPVSMTTTKPLKNTILDASVAVKHDDKDVKGKDISKEVDIQYLKTARSENPTIYDVPDLSKIIKKRYPSFIVFQKKMTNIYLSCIPRNITCEPSFWNALYPGEGSDNYLDHGKLDGMHINGFIEVLMRQRPKNANWTIGLCELVAFTKNNHEEMSVVSVVDPVRATIDGRNPTYPAWETISQVFFPINLDNMHWVVGSLNLDNYYLEVYDSLEDHREQIKDLLVKWKIFIRKDLENIGWFAKTGRDPNCFGFTLRYMKDKGVPQQSFKFGTQDCGVMVCKFIKMLTEGKTINMENFLTEAKDVAQECLDFRADMAIMLYQCRCERPV